MAKKHFKGYTGKTSSKIIATGVVAGTIAIGVLGANLSAKLSNRPDPDHPYNDNYISENVNNTLITEPSIDMEAGYEDYVPGETLPELKEPIITNPEEEVEDLGVEFVEVLSKLTTMSKDYIQDKTGSTPNITISGFSSINVKQNSGEVIILGQLTVGDKFNNFIANINNNDTSLEIYNLSADEITEESLVSALDQILSNNNTRYAVQLKQHMKLANEREVVKSILQTRYDELIALNSTEASIMAELTHLNELLKSNNLKLSVLLNSCIKGETGYDYSFSLAVNTGKYMYSVDHMLNADSRLATTALKATIEDYLDTATDFTVNAISSNSLNKALYLVNNANFGSNHDYTIGK